MNDFTKLKQLAQAAKEAGERMATITRPFDDPGMRADRLTYADYDEAVAPEAIIRLIEERDKLAKEIAEIVIDAGIIEKGTPLTGPQLLMLCHDIKLVISKAKEDVKACGQCGAEINVPSVVAVMEKIGKQIAESPVGPYREALHFYADPDTYFAISFFPDPPCGDFMDDFSEDHGGEYERPMPGKRARAALDDSKIK